MAGFPSVGENEANILWEVFDRTGKPVWTKHNSVAANSGTSAVAWNLRTNGGAPAAEGVYVVKATINVPGKKSQHATQKLIIVRP